SGPGLTGIRSLVWTMLRAASPASTATVIGAWASAHVTLVTNRSMPMVRIRICFIALLNQEPQRNTKRTVGAALRGRPSIAFHEGAATEGRPYSSVNGIKFRFGSV